MTIYLLWTLLAGQPVDVDAFIVKDQCVTMRAERTEMLAHARAQRPDVPPFEFSPCVGISVTGPDANS